MHSLTMRGLSLADNRPSGYLPTSGGGYPVLGGRRDEKHSCNCVGGGLCWVAGAAEVKKDTAKTPVVAGKTMTDRDMENVTAGGARW